MKKITLLFFAFCAFGFTWQLNAQSVTNQNFGANGLDSAPTVLTINAGDITVNQGQPITEVSLSNFMSHYGTSTGSTIYCDDWYSFDLSVTGGAADGTSIIEGCAADFEGLDVTGFTSITLTSVDIDDWTDTVYFDIDLVVTYETPSCPAPNTLSSANITTTSADLSWVESGTATSWDIELVDLSASETQTGTPTETGVTSPHSLSGLIPAHNYQFYVRANCEGSSSAWSGPHNFSTLALPPDNASCAEASLITCGETINGTTVGSTGTSEGSGCSIGNNGVWFTFQGTGGDITVASTSSFDHEMAITKGTCGALVNVRCEDYTASAETYTIPLTVLNESYYVYIAQYMDDSTITGTYSITLTCATPPACTQAVVASSTISENCTTSEYSVEVDITSVGDAVEISNGTDTWPITGTGIITAGPFAFGTSQDLIIVHSDTVCNLDLGSFNYMACPPANDDCSGANVISSLPYDFSQTDGVGATNNDGFITACSANSTGSMNDGLWFTFTPATDGTVDIVVSNVATGFDPQMDLYSGSCGDFSCVASADSGYSGGGESIIAQAVTAGTQYFINVGYYAGATNNPEGSFNINVSGNITLGFESIENINAFTYFPNPVKNTLNLKAQSAIQNVSVYNMLGQEVLRTSPNALNSEVDLASLQTGAYFVKVTINDATETVRVIKQ